MSKKLIAAIVVVFVLLGIGLTIWAKAVLTGDRVRSAIAAQISDRIGQPVSIGRLSASVFPRVTVDLGDVTIGEAAPIQLESVHLGADLGALLSREIQHADVVIDGADLTLPLPPFALGAAGAATGQGDTSAAPVEIVSVDTITLKDVDITSGGRTLHGDVEMAPADGGIRLQRVELSADDTDVELSGVISSFSPLEGQLEARAEQVDFDALMAFIGDFASNATAPTGNPPAAGALAAADQGPATVQRLGFTLMLDKATTGGLELTDVNAKAVVTPGRVRLEPMTFDIFGGRYDGTMTLALADTPQFEWNAAVTQVNAGQLLAFAGSPDALTGTLGGQVTLTGSGLAMEQALRSASGAARIEVTDGTVQGLSLVRTAVEASSGRGGMLNSAGKALAESGSTPEESEHFSRLSATLVIDDGVMRTDDLAFDSTDADLTAAGNLTLQTLRANFDGRIQLSEELSKEAGTDLYKYSQENGRVTLPVRVEGPLGNLSVTIDLQAAAGRALKNKATEEAQDILERNLPDRLKSLFKKKPPK